MNKNLNRLWIVVLSLGWLFDFLFWSKPVGLNFALFSTICLFAGFGLLLADGIRPAPKSLWLLIPFGFFVVITFLRQEPLTILLAYTFTLIPIGVMASTYLGGRWMQYGLLDYISKFLELVGGMLVRPLEVHSQERKERITNGENRKVFPFGAVLRGLLIAFPVVACFASMLASADLVFNQKLNEFMDLFGTEDIFEYLQRGVYVIFCAYLLAGAFLYAASRSRDEKLLGEEQPVIKPFLGTTESGIVLGSVAILFLAFVIVQFQYFFGGQQNIGVAGYTYSQYARRGFNELVTVAFFSLVMILGLNGGTRRETQAQRRMHSGLSVLIVALVMVILVSAYQRLSLAIDWHSYSRLRLYPRVFLVWVGILLLAIVILEIYRRERYFTFAFLLASFGFAASLALINVDEAIVRYNVSRVLQGKNLNVFHLSSLSTDAVPALADEYMKPSLPASIREGLGAALLCYIHSDLISEGISMDDWRSFNYSRWRAHQALQEIQGELAGYRILEKRTPMLVRTPANVQYECGQ